MNHNREFLKAIPSKTSAMGSVRAHKVILTAPQGCGALCNLGWNFTETVNTTNQLLCAELQVACCVSQKILPEHLKGQSTHKKLLP